MTLEFAQALPTLLVDLKVGVFGVQNSLRPILSDNLVAFKELAEELAAAESSQKGKAGKGARPRQEAGDRQFLLFDERADMQVGRAHVCGCALGGQGARVKWMAVRGRVGARRWQGGAVAGHRANCKGSMLMGCGASAQRVEKCACPNSYPNHFRRQAYAEMMEMMQDAELQQQEQQRQAAAAAQRASAAASQPQQQEQTPAEEDTARQQGPGTAAAAAGPAVAGSGRAGRGTRRTTRTTTDAAGGTAAGGRAASDAAAAGGGQGPDDRSSGRKRSVRSTRGAS